MQNEGEFICYICDKHFYAKEIGNRQCRIHLVFNEYALDIPNKNLGSCYYKYKSRFCNLNPIQPNEICCAIDHVNSNTRLLQILNNPFKLIPLSLSIKSNHIFPDKYICNFHTIEQLKEYPYTNLMNHYIQMKDEYEQFLDENQEEEREEKKNWFGDSLKNTESMEFIPCVVVKRLS